MILPDKYTDFNLSLLSFGGVILKSLENCHVQKYGEVEELAVSKIHLRNQQDPDGVIHGIGMQSS